MLRTGLLVAATSLLLGGCVPTSALKMHDVYLHGFEDARYTYFFGEPGQLLFEGRTVVLSAPEAGSASTRAALAVPGALLIDGAPFLREPLPPPGSPVITVSRIPFTTDMQVALSAAVEEAVYFDGESFLVLLQRGEAGTVQRVVPRPRFNQLRGLGELTSAEADVLANALKARRRPFALAVLPTSDLPAHPVDGLSEHRRTGVYVQLEVPIDESAYRPVPEELLWEVVASGNQAVGFSSAQYEIVSSQDQLISLWQKAYGSQLTVPPLPRLDLRRDTVVALFLGAKSSGGYGVEVRSVREEGGELYLDVLFSQPPAGALTTQAITSPWVLVRVQRGGFPVAWLRDADRGELVGVARRLQ